MNKRFWCALVVVLAAADTLLTYWQNYQLPLDGDLVPTVLPAPFYSKVLQDPFGWAVLTRNEIYAAPNRFFAHGAMSLYWKQVPRLLQHFMAPISSLYASSALFNTAVHALILFTLAAYVRLGAGMANKKWTFWLAIALLLPLFQTAGFAEQMSITNHAVTYTFFYGFPIALLLVLLWPFYRAACLGEQLRLRFWQMVLLVLLMVVVSFNGPIATAAVAVVLSGIGVYWGMKQWQIRGRRLSVGWLSGQALALLSILAVLSLYSIYIGRNNIENGQSHTLGELYQLLPTGFVGQLRLQNGLPVLVLFVLANGLLTRFLTPDSEQRQRVLFILRGVGLFALVFILLLPFGGYRSYRPYLIRGDSILPVVVGLIFAYGVSGSFLLSRLRGGIRVGYITIAALFAGYFMYADSALEMPYNNGCERWALEQIAQSPEPVVHISAFCPVLSWAPVSNSEDTKEQSAMLYYWGVTPRKKLYYQQ